MIPVDFDCPDHQAIPSKICSLCLLLALFPHMKLTAVKYYCSNLGNPPQRAFAIRASMNRVIFLFTVSPDLFNCSPGVFSDNQTILHSIVKIIQPSSLLCLLHAAIINLALICRTAHAFTSNSIWPLHCSMSFMLYLYCCYKMFQTVPSHSMSNEPCMLYPDLIHKDI